MNVPLTVRGGAAGPERWLARAPEWLFALYAGTVAFGTYFAMYAYRKPFAVADFSNVAPVGVSYKIALVIAQVFGYALAKGIGVRVIAELPPRRRITGIAMQVALAEAALVLFGLLPAPWNIAAMFLDGLALGMVWGMVFGFVEGRRQSDLIGAILCASFILSSGVVKSVGETVLIRGWAGPFWMPALTGLLFAPLLVVCLFGLSALPPPSAHDVAERVKRVAMPKPMRKALLRRFGPGLFALFIIYMALTALRDFRDNFAAEIWTEVGLGGRADIFAWTELPISAIVLAAMASITMVRDNRRAMLVNFGLVGVGLALVALASLAFTAHFLGPVAWMVVMGSGLYLAYTPFNGMLFDRLVAAGGSAANAGFLIYLADSFGYAASVALVVLRNLTSVSLPWARFLTFASIGSGLTGLIILAWAARWFQIRMAR